MQDDEDTYGFGSFSDLFDVGPAQTTKRLDLDALNPFCMSERLLTRFQQQRRDKRSLLFQHVAAKFDGVRIDGGLGALGVTPLESGGIVWIQTSQSDSDALERRKKELQDITNRCSESDEDKSAAALFVAVKHVAKVQPIIVQNTVQGVEIKLMNGNKLELIFMPGPFADPTHRDEFLEALKKQMRDDKETQKTINTPDRRSDVALVKKPAKLEQKEKFRQLVRRYMKLDEMSGEALEIVKQVYAGTGYHLGPMAKEVPMFSVDVEYRKKTVSELTEYLQRMNKEWSEAEADRLLGTKAKHSRNEDDLFEYIDTVTGEQIPIRTYEQRYLEYVKAHEVNPVLRMFPVHEKRTTEHTSTQNGAELLTHRSDALSEPDESARALFMGTLGINISSSCIIDKDFFSSGAAHPPPDKPTYRVEDAAFRAAVDSARMKIWKSWGSTFARVRGNCASSVGRDHPKSQIPVTGSVPVYSVTRKRPRDRRRSLVLPNSDDLQSTVEANVTKSLQDENGTASSAGDSLEPRTKRSRPTSHKPDTAQKSRRRARRQSIMNTVDLPSTVAGEAATDKRKTPQSSRKTARPRHPANGYARETSSLEMVGDEDSNLCRLCFSEQALVHMKPCDHTMCASCWSQLPPSSGKSGTSSRRVCPWDREVVTKR